MKFILMSTKDQTRSKGLEITSFKRKPIKEAPPPPPQKKEFRYDMCSADTMSIDIFLNKTNKIPV